MMVICTKVIDTVNSTSVSSLTSVPPRVASASPIPSHDIDRNAIRLQTYLLLYTSLKPNSSSSNSACQNSGQGLFRTGIVPCFMVEVPTVR